MTCCSADLPSSVGGRRATAADTVHVNAIVQRVWIISSLERHSIWGMAKSHG